MSFKTSITILLSLIAAVLLFHLAILAKLIPYSIAWGGRLQSDQEMYVFEIISIVINLLFGLVLLMKAGYIRFSFNKKVINMVLWSFLVLFVLNTIGNLFAKTNFEKAFSVLTLLSSFLIWRILKADHPDKDKG